MFMLAGENSVMNGWLALQGCIESILNMMILVMLVIDEKCLINLNGWGYLGNNKV